MPRGKVKQPKNAPSLGIGDPISHVTPRSQEFTDTVLGHQEQYRSRQDTVRRHNEEQTQNAANIKSGWPARGHGRHIEFLNESAPKGLVQINTDPAKGK